MESHGKNKQEGHESNSYLVQCTLQPPPSSCCCCPPPPCHTIIVITTIPILTTTTSITSSSTLLSHVHFIPRAVSSVIKALRFPPHELLTIPQWSNLPFKPQVPAQALPPSRISPKALTAEPPPQTTLSATFPKSSQMPPEAAIAQKLGEFCGTFMTVLTRL